NDAPIVPNIGILASQDPVAIDAASADLVNQAHALPGSAIDHLAHADSHADKLAALYPEVDWTVQLRHAERIGLGTRDYTLVSVGVV
ncbi:MAG: 4Fe-4S ferredoxin, partial [Bacillota bacterium]